MKLRKMLALVVSVAMVGVLAITASANAPILSDNLVSEGAGIWEMRAHVSGSSVAPPLEGIDPNLIRGFRVVFSNVVPFTDPEDGAETATATIATMSIETDGGRGWYEYGGPFDLWEDGVGAITGNLTREFEFDGRVEQYMQISVGLWDEGSSADVRVYVLGENGVVLADGAVEGEGETTTAAATTTTTIVLLLLL
jgi:hypothetical protein